jgi:nucleoside-diphosphate-sugar epimerase
VLVTGAGGFIAPHLIRRLVDARHEVIGLAQREVELPEDADLVVRDLGQPLDDDDLPAVDGVVHLAQANFAFPDGARALFRVNSASTHDLLEFARRCGATHFVYASSGSIYGLGDGAVDEEAPRRALDFYAVTKQIGELLVDSYSQFLTTTTLRLFAPYGPRQTRRLIPNLVERVANGTTIRLNAGGRPRITPIYVDDAVRVVERALRSSNSAIVNVAGDEEVSIEELAELIGDVVGRPPVFDRTNAEAGGDLVAANGRMKALFELGQLVPLAEGLADVVRERELV